MQVYLDTSIVVAAVTNEPHTPQAHALLGADPFRAFLISDWTVTEVASALSMKVRMGGLLPSERALAARAFRRLAQESLARTAVVPADFERAAQLSEDPAAGIRAGDVLRLAVVERLQASLCTFDPTMARAAAALRLAVVGEP